MWEGGEREGEQKIRNDGSMSGFGNKENRILKGFRKFHPSSNSATQRDISAFLSCIQAHALVTKLLWGGGYLIPTGVLVRGKKGA